MTWIFDYKYIPEIFKGKEYEELILSAFNEKMTPEEAYKKTNAFLNDRYEDFLNACLNEFGPDALGNLEKLVKMYEVLDDRIFRQFEKHLGSNSISRCATWLRCWGDRMEKRKEEDKQKTQQ